MTLIEFISIGLRYGQRCKVTIGGQADQTPVTYELFFAGFRFFCGRTTGYGRDDIIPIFNEPAKNGKMSYRRFRQTYWLNTLLSVEPADSEKTYLNRRDIDGLDRAIQRCDAACRDKLNEIVNEMDGLFPGKKILIQQAIRPGAIYFDKNSCCSCLIDAVYVKDSKIVYDISDGYMTETTVPQNLVGIGTADNHAGLLLAVIDSIEDPVFSDEGFIREDTPWTDIPDTDRKKTPALLAAGCLDKLKQNRWFDSLPLQRKQELLKGEFSPEDIPDDFTASSAFAYGLDEHVKAIIYNTTAK